MADLTPLFRQCVNIVSKELVENLREDFDSNKIRETKPDESQFKIKDTFVKESTEFYQALVSINKFLEEIKVPYLSMDDGTGYDELLNSLTTEDKNKIDQEINFKIQQMYEKMKLLQTYESARQGNSLSVVNKGNWINSIFGENEPSDEELYEKSISIYRTQVLKFLSTTINLLSKKCESMQRKRFKRQKQLNFLNFQNFEDYEDLNYNQEITDHSDALLEFAQNEAVSQQQLTQEQLLELELENKEFLSLKTNQLKEVQALHNSMIDIVNLQTELSFQLEQQGEKINNLLDDQGQIEVDVSEGNKSLNQATKRNKQGANMLVSTCLLLGFLILFIDYISY